MDQGDATCMLFAAFFSVVLIGCYGAGRLIRRFVPSRHRSREATEILLSVTAMLVTFSAIVLGLMLTSSFNRLQHLDALVGNLAVEMVQLDDALVEYGPEAQLAHVALVNYARRELDGLSDAKTQVMTRSALQQVGAAVASLDSGNPARRAVGHDALERFYLMVEARFRLQTEGAGSSNGPFYLALAWWLALTYFVFGLNVESNAYIKIALGASMSAIAVASFVILDTNAPLGGIVSVSRAPLVEALHQFH